MSEPALMTEAAPAPSLVLPSASPMRWRIAVLVSAAIAISYLDRQTLPWAITAIQRDIPISNQVKAFLDSAFLVTYGLMYLGGGRFVDYLGTRRGFLAIMIFWSLACASHGLAGGYGFPAMLGLPFSVLRSSVLPSIGNSRVCRLLPPSRAKFPVARYSSFSSQAFSVVCSVC